MADAKQAQLTDRQRNEVEYHRQHATERADLLSRPLSFEVLEHPTQRWWNAYWRMYAHLAGLELGERQTLVIGCGFGDDALRLAKLGARVHAFDLSPESLAIAKERARREGLAVAFAEMPAEKLDYPDDSFDCIVARDIFHHIDIPRAMAEILRVARPGAMLVVNEIYSHSATERIRRSSIVERILYPRLRRHIYGDARPYITQDERKLTESDVQMIMAPLDNVRFVEYFNFLVTRVIPDRYDALAKLDRLALIALKPLASLIAGRVLFAGSIAKTVMSMP